MSTSGRVTAVLAAICCCWLAPAPALAAEDQAQPEAVAEIAAGNVDFGVALYGKLAAEEGNVFISPISLAGVFGPVVAGAEGATRDAIMRTLNFPEEERLHPALGGLLRQLEAPRDGATVAIANALWPDQRFTPAGAFVDVSVRHYDAMVETLDFRAPKRAAARVNGWASEQTKGRISNVVGPGHFSGSSLVITNAVYMLADWEVAFDKALTREEPFHLPDGATRPVPLMHRDGEFRYLETEAFQAIDLPYRDGRLSMSLFLPKRAHRDFDGALGGSRLRGWLAELDGTGPRRVKLYLPRLQIEEGYELGRPLQAMGVAQAFRDGADFSGIAAAPLAIGDVIQKTFLRIDEKGTEAAAVTAMTIMITGMRVEPPVPVFRADRPFFLVIRDKPSGAVLFLGRIEAPEPAADLRSP